MGVSTRFTPDPNDAIDAEGRTHHLQVRAGDVAPRVLSVGDVGRAARIAAHLDASPAPITITSSRGFVTHTGCYKGVPVSVIATLMGISNMDFVVREVRAVVNGPLAIVRFGTCGGLRDVPAGAVVLATGGAVLIRRDPDTVGEALATPPPAPFRS